MAPSSSAVSTWRDLIAYQAQALFLIDRSLKQAGCISLAFYDVLIELKNAPGGALRFHELSRSCALTRSGVTKIVRSLERQGLVQRQRSPDDKRGVLAIITPLGLAEVKKAWPPYAAGIQRYFSSVLNQTELDVIYGYLKRLRSATAE